MLKKVYICSPLGGNIALNLEKAKLKEGGYLSPEFKKIRQWGQNNSNNTFTILKET